LTHQTDGAYWRTGSLRGGHLGGYDRIRCPAFLIGGWRDGYPNPPFRTFAQLRVPKKVLVGPWDHAWPDAAIPGPRIDWLRELRRWCDHWLKGEANGVPDEPAVTFYVQSYDEPRPDRLDTSGYWRTAQDVSLPGATERVLYLAPAGGLSDTPPAPDPTTSLTEDGDGAPGDAYEYRPTVGMTGGLWSGGLPFGLPTDQRADDALSLTYTTAPLPGPMEIVGRPEAVLHVRSTAPVMAFVARLCDVAPDGSSALVCRGVLNGTRRASLTHPEAMDPETTYELRIELDCTAWRFESGHRIRLSVSSADFPNVWPTPLAGTNRVYRGERLPSRVRLPVVPPGSGTDEASFERPRKEAHGVYQLSPRDPPWRFVQDVLGDQVGLQVRTSDVAHPNEWTELTSDERAELWASNRDPADVVATGHHLHRFVRRDGTTTVETDCVVRSTLTAFHVTIQVQVILNGLPLHHRSWARSFPRALL
jgi:predicted acyl esterase